MANNTSKARIQNYLIETLKQDKDLYKNVTKAMHPYPCGICQKNVNWNQKSIECTSCKHWIHIKCNGTDKQEYEEMMKANAQLSEEEIIAVEWLCIKCLISKIAQLLLFGL